MTKHRGGERLPHPDPSERARYDFTVAASDRDVMRQLDRLIRQRGYIGIADTAGRMHYVVDGRDNLHRSVHQLLRLAETHYREDEEAPSLTRASLLQQIDATLSSAGLRRELRGYRLLSYMLEHSVFDESLLQPLNKGLYVLAGERFRMRISQVERTLRYCIEDAGYELGNGEMIKRLHAELMVRVGTERERTRESTAKGGVQSDDGSEVDLSG